MEKTYLISMNAEELETMITRCVRTVLSEMKLDPQASERPNIGGIELAVRVTGLAKATLYALVSKRMLPHKKVGGRLHFVESELIDWINQHHRKTIYEIEQDAREYINNRYKNTNRKRRY